MDKFSSSAPPEAGKGVTSMRITFHAGQYTVTIIVKSGNRRSAARKRAKPAGNPAGFAYCVVN